MPLLDSEGSYLLCKLQPIGHRVNLLHVAAHQRPGLETRHRDARSVVKQTAGVFLCLRFVLFGGRVRETFVSAELSLSRFPACARLPPIAWKRCVAVSVGHHRGFTP